MKVNAQELQTRINKLQNDIQDKNVIDDIDLITDVQKQQMKQETEEAKQRMVEENKAFQIENLKKNLTLGSLPGEFSDEICLFTALAQKQNNCEPEFEYVEDKAH